MLCPVLMIALRGLRLWYQVSPERGEVECVWSVSCPLGAGRDGALLYIWSLNESNRIGIALL